MVKAYKNVFLFSRGHLGFSKNDVDVGCWTLEDVRLGDDEEDVL